MAATALGSRAIVLASCLLGVLATAALPPAQAHAGSWILVSCTLPDGTPAPTEGWSGASTGPVGPGSGDANSCASGGALQALVSGTSPQNAYAGPDWVFTAPSGSTITGGTLTATLTSPHGQAWLGTPALTYDSADVLANCQYNLTCGLSGTLEGSFPILHPAGGHLYAAAVCVAAVQGATECPADGGLDAAVSVHAAEIVLANDATPTGEGFTGGLLAGGARGSADLAFTAVDPDGPGVYRVTIQLDASTVYEGTPDPGGGCVLSGQREGALMFTSTQPCRQRESIDEALDTTGFIDGPHTLKVTVTDAAGNASVVQDTTVTTDNAPVASALPSVSAGAQLSGRTLEANPGAWSAPAGAGPITYAYRWQACQSTEGSCAEIPGASEQSYTPTAAQVGHSLRVIVSASDRDGASDAASQQGQPVAQAQVDGSLLSALAPGPANGAPASRDAVLRLDGPSRITRSYSRSRLELTGHLRTAAGAPIAAATLDVLTRDAGSQAESSVGRTITSPDGAFRVTVPQGPSRTVTITYTAYAGQPAVPASASMSESVPARVSLNVSPRRTYPRGTISLSGRVDGVEGGGVQVNLLVFYRGRWEPFRTPRTDRAGRFRVRYRFEGAVGSFPFRASVPAGQTGLPYAAGTSHAVRVLTQ